MVTPMLNKLPDYQCKKGSKQLSAGTWTALLPRSLAQNNIGLAERGLRSEVVTPLAIDIIHFFSEVLHIGPNLFLKKLEAAPC